ncbi:uncharacterized protein LOC105686131 isoform X2 [Athalia rosae]|uniref:uncharacterized protein LOC105686131 isoform X2 n=1 Tax=Athalia rosae TaxID=37344 RepID=UPI00203394C3|nr:uncharacterized protein LOC105686131 isoform X2 [Athalia rosae]
MVINGQQAAACYGGLGTYVFKGENRVNDLECHANGLRERLDRLEAMLPNALIEANGAIQRGERPPDYLQLSRAEEAGSRDVQSCDCGEARVLEDEPPVCMLRVLARKEKRLRKKIYEMEVKEERYKKALAEAGRIFSAGETDGPDDAEIPCAENSSLDEFCKKCCGYNERVAKLNLPEDPEAWKTLAGQFKAAYKKAEKEGLPPGVREPVRITAEKIQAMSNFSPESCPCGQPVKCNSCVICSCAEWERDLELGGGDEPPEDSSSDGRESRKVVGKSGSGGREGCRCGCNETSSESDCPCGCPSSATASSERSSTVTDTTLPSFESDESGGSNDLEKGGEDTTPDIPRVVEHPETTSAANEGAEKTCAVCPCVCTTCGTATENGGRDPEAADDGDLDNVPDVAECSCPDLSEVPPEIRKVCRIERLREGVEGLKNRNHFLRELLKSRGCSPSLVDDSRLSSESRDEGVRVQGTASGLLCTVALLQSKCRTKDDMILALADELRKDATPERTERILERLAWPSPAARGVSDFDRSELWNYLRKSSNGVAPGSDDPEKDESGRPHDACPCPRTPRIPDPPREFKVRRRVSGDGLILSWLPPLEGPVSGYEVLAEGETVARIRRPMRTETFVGGLDLGRLVLLEVRTVARNGLRSKTAEKLFNPARFGV